MFGITRSCGCVKSRPQAELFQFVTDHGFEAVLNDRQAIAPLELDIYVPEKRIAIEYHGLFWHGEEFRPEDAKTHSIDKLRACEAANIQLVTIFEDEYLTKRQQVMDYLGAVLGAGRTKIGARSCVVESATSTEVRKFLNTYHLQGGANGKCYRLVYKGETVAVAVFARINASRASKADANCQELVRYCVKGGHQVQGGLGKLLAAFRKDYPEVVKIISYSDNRWSQGRLYKALGFRRETQGVPSYFYFKSHTQGPREHRYKYRRSVALNLFGGGPEDTEIDIMKRAGYDRVWDCGASRWVLDLRS